MEAKLILTDVLNQCEYELLTKIALYFQLQRDFFKDSAEVLNKIVPELNTMAEKVIWYFWRENIYILILIAK